MPECCGFLAAGLAMIALVLLRKGNLYLQPERKLEV